MNGIFLFVPVQQAQGAFCLALEVLLGTTASAEVSICI